MQFYVVSPVVADWGWWLPLGIRTQVSSGCQNCDAPKDGARDSHGPVVHTESDVLHLGFHTSLKQFLVQLQGSKGLPKLELFPLRMVDSQQVLEQSLDMQIVGVNSWNLKIRLLSTGTWKHARTKV